MLTKPKTERNLFIELLGETHWMTLPDTIVTTRVRYFTTGGPDKEHRTDKPLPTGRVWERSKGDATFPTDFPEASSLESILAEQCVQHQEGPWVRVTGQRQPGNPSYHHKTWDHVAEQSSSVPAPLPGHGDVMLNMMGMVIALIGVTTQ